MVAIGEPMTEHIKIPPAPSPGFTPPDAGTAKKLGLTTRSVKRESLTRFLQERKGGQVDMGLLWALFLCRTITPALDAYLDSLDLL